VRGAFSWSVFLALLAANYVASYVSYAVLAAASGAAVTGGETTVILLNGTVGALVGGIVIPHVLRMISDLHISFANAAVALFAGSMVGAARELVIGSPVSASPATGLVPSLAATATSYLLLLTYVSEPAPSAPRVSSWVPPASDGSYEEVIRETQFEVERLCDRVAEAAPIDVASRVQDGVVTLELRADRVAELVPPDPNAQAAQAKLVRGLRALIDELTAIARTAPSYPTCARAGAILRAPHDWRRDGRPHRPRRTDPDPGVASGRPPAIASASQRSGARPLTAGRPPV
jgi:hypothetical protein